MSKSVSNGRRTQSNAPLPTTSSRSPSAMSAAPLQPRSASSTAGGYTRAQSLASEAMLMSRPAYGRGGASLSQSDARLPLLGAPESAQYGSHQRNAATDQSSHLLRFVQNRTAGTRFDLPTETFFTGRRVVKELRDVFARCFACVGETVWIGEKSGVLSIWDLKTGEQMGRRERQPKIFITAVTAVGLYVWVGYSDGMLRVFNPENMQLLKEVKEHLGSINQILIAFNGLTVYTASADFTINQWDTANVERIATLSGHKNNVRCVVTAGGTRLFSASDDKCIIEWDMSTAKPRHVMKNAHSKPIRCLTAASGHLWSGSEDGTVKIWSLSSSSLGASGGTASPPEDATPAMQQQHNRPSASLAATSLGRGESQSTEPQRRGVNFAGRSLSADRPGDDGYDMLSPAPKGGGGGTPTSTNKQHQSNNNGKPQTPLTNNMMTPAAAALGASTDPPPLVHVISNPHTSVITHLHTVGSKVWSACLGTLFIWDSATFALEGQFNEHDGFVTALMAVHQSSVARVWSCGSEGVVKMWNSESQWTSAFRAAQEEHLREMEALLSDAVAREERLAQANESSEENIRVLSQENARIAARANELEDALERERLHSLDLRKAIDDMEAEQEARRKADKEEREQAAIDDSKRAEEEANERERIRRAAANVKESEDPLTRDLQRLLDKICRSSIHRSNSGISNNTGDDNEDDELNFGDDENMNNKRKSIPFDKASYDALQKALRDISRLNAYEDGPYSSSANKNSMATAMDELEALKRWKNGDYGFGALAGGGLRNTQKKDENDVLNSNNPTDRVLDSHIKYVIIKNPDGTKTAKIIQDSEDDKNGTLSIDGKKKDASGVEESLASRLTSQNNALRMELLALRVQIANLHRQAHLATSSSSDAQSPLTTANTTSSNNRTSNTKPTPSSSDQQQQGMFYPPAGATEVSVNAISEADLDTLMQIKTRAVECLKKEIAEREAAAAAMAAENDANAMQEGCTSASSGSDDEDMKRYYDALRTATVSDDNTKKDAFSVIELRGRSTIKMSQDPRITVLSSTMAPGKQNDMTGVFGPIPVTSSLSVEDRAKLALLRQKYAPIHQDSTVMCGEKEAGIVVTTVEGEDGTASTIAVIKPVVRWGAPAAANNKTKTGMSLNPVALSSAPSEAVSNAGSTAGPLHVTSCKQNVHLVAVMPPDDAFLVAKASRDSTSNNHHPLENPLPSAAVLGYITVEELSPSEVKALERVVLEDRKRRQRSDPTQSAPQSGAHTSKIESCSSVFFRPSNNGFAAAAADGGGSPSPQRSGASRVSSALSNGATTTTYNNNSSSSNAVNASQNGSNNSKRSVADREIDHLLHLQAVIDRTVPVGILLPPLHTLPEKELELVFMIYQRHRGTDYAKLLLDQDEKQKSADAAESEAKSKKSSDGAVSGYSRVKEAQKRSKETSDTNAKAALKLLPNTIGGVRLSVDSIRADAEATLAEVLYESELTKQRLSDVQAEIDAAHAILDNNVDLKRCFTDTANTHETPVTPYKGFTGVRSSGSHAGRKQSLISQSPSVITVSSRAPYNARWAPGATATTTTSGRPDTNKHNNRTSVIWGDMFEQSSRSDGIALGGVGGGGNSSQPFGNASVRSKSPNDAPVFDSKPTESLPVRLQQLAAAVNAHRAAYANVDATTSALQGGLMDALKVVERLCTTGSTADLARRASRAALTNSPATVKATVSRSASALHISSSDDDDETIDSDEVNDMVINAREIITGRASSTAAENTAGEVDPEVEALKRREADFFDELRGVIGKQNPHEQSRHSFGAASVRWEGGAGVDCGESFRGGASSVRPKNVPILNDNDKAKIEEAMQKALFAYRKKNEKRASIVASNVGTNADGGRSASAEPHQAGRRRSSARRGSQVLVPRSLDEEAVAHAAALSATAAALAEKHNGDQQQLRQALRQLDLLKGEASEESERSAQRKAGEVAELKQQLHELRDEAQKQHNQRLINDDLRSRLAALSAELEEMYRQWRRRDYTVTRKQADESEKRDRAQLTLNVTPKALIPGARVVEDQLPSPIETSTVAMKGMAQRSPSSIRSGGAPVSEMDEHRESRMNELLEDAADQLQSNKVHDEALKSIQDRIASHDRIPYTFLKHYPAKGVTLNDILERVLEDPSFRRHARDRNVFLRQKQEEERGVAAKGEGSLRAEMDQKPDGTGAAFKLRFTTNKSATTSNSNNRGIHAATEEDLARITRNLDESIQRQEDALNSICTEIAEAYQRNYLLQGFKNDDAPMAVSPTPSNSSQQQQRIPAAAVSPDVIAVYARKLDAVRLDNVVLRQDLSDSKERYETLRREFSELHQRVEKEIPLHESSPAAARRTTSNITNPTPVATLSASSMEAKVQREQKVAHLALLQLAREELKEIRCRDHTTFINTLLDIEVSPTHNINRRQNCNSPPNSNSPTRHVNLPSEENIQRANAIAASRRRQLQHGSGGACLDFPLDEAAQQAVDELYETEIALGLRREQRLAKQVDKLQAMLEREKLRSNRTEKDLDTADKEKSRADIVKKDRLEKENIALQKSVSQLEVDIEELRDQLSNSQVMIAQVQQSRKKMVEDHEKLKQIMAEKEADGQFKFQIPPPKHHQQQHSNHHSQPISRTESGSSTTSKPQTFNVPTAGTSGNRVDGNASSFAFSSQRSRSPVRNEEIRQVISGDASEASSTPTAMPLQGSVTLVPPRVQSRSPIPDLARRGSSNNSSRAGTPQRDDASARAGSASPTNPTTSRGRASSGKRVGFDERGNAIMDRSPSAGRRSKHGANDDDEDGFHTTSTTGGDDGGGNQYQELPPLSPRRTAQDDHTSSSHQTPPRQVGSTSGGGGGNVRSASPVVSAREARHAEEALRVRLANTEKLLGDAKRELRSLRSAEEARRDDEMKRRIASLSASSYVRDSSASDEDDSQVYFNPPPLEEGEPNPTTTTTKIAKMSSSSSPAQQEDKSVSGSNTSPIEGAVGDVDGNNNATSSSSSSPRGNKALTRHAGVNTEEPYPTKTCKATGNVRFATTDPTTTTSTEEADDAPATTSTRKSRSKVRSSSSGQGDTEAANQDQEETADVATASKKFKITNMGSSDDDEIASSENGDHNRDIDNGSNDADNSSKKTNRTKSSGGGSSAKTVLDRIADVQAGMHNLREDTLIEEIERLGEQLEDLQTENDARKANVDDLEEELEELRGIRDSLVSRTVQLEQDVENSRIREDMLVEALAAAAVDADNVTTTSSQQAGSTTANSNGDGEGGSVNTSAISKRGGGNGIDVMSSPEAKNYVTQARQQAEELEVRNAELQLKLRETERELQRIKSNDPTLMAGSSSPNKYPASSSSVSTRRALDLEDGQSSEGTPTTHRVAPTALTANKMGTENSALESGEEGGDGEGEFRRYDDDYNHSVIDRYKDKNATLARQLTEALQTAKLATEMYEEEREKNGGGKNTNNATSSRPQPRRDVDAERFNALVNQLEEEILNASVASGFVGGDVTNSTAGGGKAAGGGGTIRPNAASLLASQLLGDPRDVDHTIQMRRRDLQLGLGLGIRNPTASKDKINDAFEETIRYFSDREKRWRQFANQQNLTANTHLKMLTESTELASKLRTLSHLFETRPILIRALYEIYKLLVKTLKINNYHRKIIGNRPLTRSEGLDQNSELSEEVEMTKEGARWVIANLFTSFELCHIGASPSMFIPDGRRPTWRDIVIPEKYQRIISQASHNEEEQQQQQQQRSVSPSNQAATPPLQHQQQPPVPSSVPPPSPQSRGFHRNSSVLPSQQHNDVGSSNGAGPHHHGGVIGRTYAAPNSAPSPVRGGPNQTSSSSLPVRALGYNNTTNGGGGVSPGGGGRATSSASPRPRF